MGILASCYFTTVPDPQRKVMMPNNNMTYIKDWYESGGNLIFHDNLSDEFISWFPKAEFIKVPSPDIDLLKYRWVVYYDYLKQHPEIESIFFTDICDSVKVNEPVIEKDILYCGDEEKTINSWIFQNTCPALNELIYFDRLWQINDKLLNAGIIGGKKAILLFFLGIMNEVIDEISYADKDILGDMAIFNYAVFTYFDNIVHGFPVNSKFGQYEKRNDVWFIHR